MKKKVKALERKLRSDDEVSREGNCEWHGPVRAINLSPQRTGDFGFSPPAKIPDQTFKPREFRINSVNKEKGLNALKGQLMNRKDLKSNVS